jgi:hypothetical protein
MNIIRGVILAFECGTWLILVNLLKPHDAGKGLAIYALNPLVILELTGNLHFEGIVLFFVLLAIFAFQKYKYMHGAVALAFGVLTKLTPLMFLPLLFKKKGLKKSTIAFLLIGVVIFLFSIPLINLDVLIGFKQSLSLFFYKFEFNASLFFLVRFFGFQMVGYDVIQTFGPLMSIVSLFIILIYSLVVVKKETDWSVAISTVLFTQLIFATTVHPWYIIPLVALSPLTGYLFPIFWSYLIFLTYVGYLPDGYSHQFSIIALEYIIVIGLAGYEILLNKPLLKNYV